MKSVITAKSDLSTELAGLLARAYVRLTETRRVSPESGADSGAENLLDLSADLSVHVVTESLERRLKEA